MDGNRTFSDTLYERDFAAWAAEQGRMMRAGEHDRVDWENVIEEIESLGRNQLSALRSCVALVIEHLLKRDHGLNDEPKRQWQLTITTQRIHARKRLKENPSLKPLLPSLIEEEYEDARALALASFKAHEPVRLDHYRATLPELCPYTEADVLG